MTGDVLDSRELARLERLALLQSTKAVARSLPPYTGPRTMDMLSLAELERLAERQAAEVLTEAIPAAPLRTPPRRGAHHKAAERSGALYAVIVGSWLLLLVLLAGAVRPVVEAAFRRDASLGVMTVFTALFIAYFWLNGLKDIAYPVAYRLMRHPVPPPREDGALPLVGLLYATCNDFSAESLDRSLRQDYPNCTPVILDDSSKAECIAEVDEYARRCCIPVVRRTGRAGFKAGNLNNYLRGAGRRLDFFVIIDSDEILPRGFVTRALEYFADDPSTGIVQANHVATRNRTSFMRMFAPGVDAHWPAYQAVKTRFGFMSLLGHGAMVSRGAYLAAGGFPHVVAEDIGFAIDVRRAGYRTVFATDITCEEEFPPDYAAFKKRHRKWTEGNMEFIRRYSGRILLRPGLTWYERLDIVLFTYSLPLTGIFSLYVMANAVVFPLLGFRYHYPLWMLVPTVAFLLAPMLNDALTWSRAPKGKLASYLLHSVALFGSVYFVSLFASLRTMFGRSVFHVTPKIARGAGLRAALRQNAVELVAGTVLAAAVAGASGSVLPVILLLIPVTFGMYLSVMNAGDATPGPRDGKHVLQEKD